MAPSRALELVRSPEAPACRAATEEPQPDQSLEDEVGLELFRLAVCDRDQEAWEAIFARYRPLLVGWARRHPAYGDARVDAEDVAVRALGRFWMAVGPEQLDRFRALAALLQYLKTCVRSVLMDELRTRRDALIEPLDGPESVEPSVEDPSERELQDWDLWCATRRVLPDQPSQLAIYLSFARGMKPADIHRLFPQHYDGVPDVYRVKRNALDRLRRSPEMLRYLSAS